MTLASLVNWMEQCPAFKRLYCMIWYSRFALVCSKEDAPVPSSSDPSIILAVQFCLLLLLSLCLLGSESKYVRFYWRMLWKESKLDVWMEMRVLDRCVILLTIVLIRLQSVLSVISVVFWRV